MTSALALTRDAFTGSRIGNYEVLCRLAVSETAEIFLGFPGGISGPQKLLVIKRLLPELGQPPELRKLLIDQARIASRLAHPNIAQVFEAGSDGSELFFAMEYVAGASLQEMSEAYRATGQPLPLGLMLAAVRDVALALEYAHSRSDAIGSAKQVIHRGVAPTNIVVTYQGTTKLLDFGTAVRASRTAAGEARGSSGYLSPEQMRDKPLDGRTDLFSLAVVAHECLTGRALYDAPSLPEIIRKVTLESPPAPSRFNRKVSAELDAVVLKGLAKGREHRYPTALEFARELERVAGAQVWQPEQVREVVRRLFAARYEQLTALLGSADDESGIAGRFDRLVQPSPRSAAKPAERIGVSTPAVLLTPARPVPMPGLGGTAVSEGRDATELAPSPEPVPTLANRPAPRAEDQTAGLRAPPPERPAAFEGKRDSAETVVARSPEPRPTVGIGDRVTAPGLVSFPSGEASSDFSLSNPFLHQLAAEVDGTQVRGARVPLRDSQLRPLAGGFNPQNFEPHLALGEFSSEEIGHEVSLEPAPDEQPRSSDPSVPESAMPERSRLPGWLIVGASFIVTLLAIAAALAVLNGRDRVEVPAKAPLAAESQPIVPTPVVEQPVPISEPALQPHLSGAPEAPPGLVPAIAASQPVTHPAPERPVRKAPKHAARPGAPAKSSAKSGLLEVNCVPWCRVQVDKLPAVDSPVKGLKLAPGRHRVRVVNLALGITREREAVVEENQVTKVLIRF